MLATPIAPGVTVTRTPVGVISELALRRLMAAFGGQQLYIPSAGAEPSAISEALLALVGEEYAVLVEAFGGTMCAIPSTGSEFERLRRQIRADAVGLLSAAGYSARQIAIGLGLPESSVRYLKSQSVSKN